MRRRHPHLFDLGDAEPWERIKRQERQGRTLAGIVPTLPPLLKAYRLQERAASVGFDWPDAAGPTDEGARGAGGGGGRAADARQRAAAQPTGRPQHARAAPSDALVDEIGDLLFAVVNLARKAGVQPGSALDRANRKFRDRFEAVERAGRATRGAGDARRARELEAAGPSCGTR